MLDTVWRISKKDFDVIKFCDVYHIKDIESLFVQGEEGRKGQINEESGFNVLVSENINSKQNVADIVSFISANTDALNYLKHNDVTSVLDIGCTVGTKDQFTKSVKLPSDFLGLIHHYGIDVEFSAYPAMDEEDEA